MFDFQWKPYVSAAKRQRKAAREIQKLKKKGHPVSPVAIEGRTIATTFWGKSWCDNLERYSDFSNRLPRGRTYVRNGSVIDLQIAPGEVKALVNGSEIYKVTVTVSAVPKPRWSSICTDCAGAIDSLVELLQGRFSKGVMARICQEKIGLFPTPSEIEFSCSCPDWASMCKHVAAVFYGIGARLDEQPELLFRLRKVDQKELIAKASHALPSPKKRTADDKLLATDGLSQLFGLEMAASEPPFQPQSAAEPSKTTRLRRASQGLVPSKHKTSPAKALKPPTSKSPPQINQDTTSGFARSANETTVVKTATPRAPAPKASSPISRKTSNKLARTVEKAAIAKAAKPRAPKVSFATKSDASKSKSKRTPDKKRALRPTLQ